MSNPECILIFHAQAELDYDNAYYWYELQDPGLGEQFLDEVRGKLKKIVAHPETYGVKSRKTYREASLKDFPYSIVYKIRPDMNAIFISSIHHERKHPNKKFRR